MEDTYFDDDAAVLAFEETLAAGKDDYSAFELGNNKALIYSLDDLYTKSGELHSVKELASNPPILRVRGKEEDGKETEFSLVLTPKVVKDLSYKCQAVEAAYRGVDVRERERVFSKPWWAHQADKTYEGVRHHPILTIFLVLILGFCVWGAITN
jgi:hypothetical protein